MKTKIKTIFVDMDGVLCNFDAQYKKYLQNDKIFNDIINSNKIISQFKLNALSITKQEFKTQALKIRSEILNNPTDTIFDKTISEFKNKLSTNIAWKIISKGKEEFWSTMDWMPDGKELIEYVKSLNINAEILTAGMGVYIKTGKQKWLLNNNLNTLKFNIVDIGILKNQYAADNVLLIDDMEKNIKTFRESNGIAVLHKNTKNTINEIEMILKK